MAPPKYVQVGPNAETLTFINWLCFSGSMNSAAAGWQRSMKQNGIPEGTLPGSINITFSGGPALATTDVLVLAWTGGTIGPGPSSTGITISTGIPYKLLVLGANTNANIAINGSSFTPSFGSSSAGGYAEMSLTSSIYAASATISFSNSYSGVTGIFFGLKSDYNTWLNRTKAADLLNPAWVAKVQEVKPKYLRFLGFNGINDNNNESQHRYRIPWNGGIGFGNQRVIQTAWAGWDGSTWPLPANTVVSQGAGSGQYVIAAAPDTPAQYTHGEVIMGTVDVGDTLAAGIQINVGGRGYRPVVNSSYSANVTSVGTGSLICYVYDEFAAVWFFLSSLYGSTGNQVPIEFEIALAAACDCPMWHQFPMHHDMISMADTVALVKSGMAGISSTVKAYFEYANEVWNTAGSIATNTTYMGFWGVNVLGVSNAQDAAGHIQAAYGWQLAKRWPLVRAAWGANASTQLRLVVASQCDGDTNAAGGISTDRFQGTQLGPLPSTITAISASATTPTVTTSAGHGLQVGQAVWLQNIAGTGAIASLNNTKAWVSPNGLTSTAFQLSSSSSSHVAISTAGGTFTSGNLVTWYSHQGFSDYTQFPNRPIDVCDTVAFATYISARFGQFEQNWQGTNGGNKSITGVTVGVSPCVVSFAIDPNYSDGQRAVINSVGGTTQLNGNHYTFHPLGSGSYALYVDDAMTTPLNATSFTTYTSGGIATADWDIHTVRAWADSYVTGNAATQDTMLQNVYNDVVAGNYAGQAISHFQSQYAAWEALMEFIEAQHARSAPLTVECYEGAYAGIAFSGMNTAQQFGLGIPLSGSQTVTFNANSSPSVNYANANTIFDAGATIQFSNSGGSLPTVTGIYFQAGGNYYIVNPTSTGFDFSTSPGGPALVVTSSGTGTTTVIGSNYVGSGGRIYKLHHAFKQSRYYYRFHEKQFADMAAAYKGKREWSSVCYNLNGNDIWAIYPGGLLSSTPYPSKDAMINANTGKRRMFAIG